MQQGFFQEWLSARGNYRSAELKGTSFITLGIIVAAALLSYSSSDPSYSHATAVPSQNFFGEVGSYFADIILQALGLAGTLLALIPAAWGIKLLRQKHFPHLKLRFAAMLFSLICMAMLLAWLPIPSEWPIQTGLGGLMGHMLKEKFSDIIHEVPALFVAAFLALATTYLAFGYRFREWQRAWQISAEKLGFVHYLYTLIRSSLSGEAALEEKPAKRTPRAKQVAPNVIETKAPKPNKKGLVETSSARNKNSPSTAGQNSLELRGGGTGKFQLPPMNILAPADGRVKRPSEASLEQNARLLESVLADFGVNGEITKVRPGPVVTLYELEPAPGTKSARVIGLADDIARSMSSISARIAVIPGRNAIGIELPNSTREMVSFRELVEDNEFVNSQGKLTIALGKNIGGEHVMVDLAKMPHLLVAGTTGSGKSVAVNTMILSLLYRLTPAECRFIMIDPKMLELSMYDGIPHLLSPVVTEPGKAVVALKWTVKEMENRYRLMSTLGVRNIDGYNKRIIEAKAKGSQLMRSVQTGFDPNTGRPVMEEVPLDMTPLPYIVVIVDEMADLMLVAGKDIESSIQRLAQMARAAGIHIIMATQRPSVDVITGVIKANFPTRISFQVTSRIDSRTILGEQGAETLLGQGDMLYMAGGGRITRTHGPFVSDQEVETVVTFLKAQGEPEYIETITIDDEAEIDFGGDSGGGSDDNSLYRQAVQIVTRDKKVSTSYVQRSLRIGYNRAADLIDRMEREGIISAPNHAGKRELLVES